MKRTNFFLRLLALVLISAVTLCGCGSVGELIEPYAPELSELGGALLDQLLETDTAAPSADGTIAPEAAVTTAPSQTQAIDRDGSYTTKEDVALYLRTYGELPGNFITKDEAKALGWVSSEGNLDKVAPGKSIGGDAFGNYEGLLPKADGRKYYECDIDYAGGFRGAKRIIYSNDGLIFYTEDHYASFEELK